MKPKYALALACLAWLGISAPAAADDEAARKIFATVCSQCHNPGQNPLDKVHHTKSEWAEALERMTTYGVDIPRDKFPELLEFLLKMQDANAAAPAQK